jgi:hypothetical protein
MDIFKLKGKDKAALKEYLSTLTDKQTKDLIDLQEYYLACYPQSTGDSELEEVLADLDELFHPEDYN